MSLPPVVLFLIVMTFSVAVIATLFSLFRTKKAEDNDETVPMGRMKPGPAKREGDTIAVEPQEVPNRS